MASLVKLKRPPVYEFSVRDIITSHVLLGFELPAIYTFFAAFSKDLFVISAGLFLHALFCLWLLYKYFKARQEDIPSKFYHPNLLPNDEYLALKRNYHEAKNGIYSCSGFFGLFSDLPNEDKTALLKSYRDVVDAISPILTDQNELRALCSFKMTFGHVETDAVYEKDGEDVVESVAEVPVSPSAPLNVDDKIVETVELPPPQPFEISAAEYDIKSQSKYVYTASQSEIKKSEFVKAQFLDGSLKEEISGKTGLLGTSLQQYYKNRRAHCRNQSRYVSPMIIPTIETVDPEIPNSKAAVSSTTQTEDNGSEKKSKNEDVSVTDSTDGQGSPIPLENKNEFCEQQTVVFTDEQLEILESGFAYTRNPEVSRREDIAEKTGLSVEGVQKWFKIRRAKHRTPTPQINGNGKEETWDLSSSDLSDDQKSSVPADHRFNGYLTNQRFRVTYTDAQLEVLESEFNYTRYPDISRREEIAAKTGLTEDGVKTWFKNRREQFRNPIRSFLPMNTSSEIQNPFATLSAPQIENCDLSANDSTNVQLHARPISFENKNEFSLRRQKRFRIVYTNEQLKVLESEFKNTHYPDCYRREKIAATTGLTVDNVETWFKNRRARHRQQCMSFSPMAVQTVKAVDPEIPNPTAAITSIAQIEDTGIEVKIQDGDLATEASTDGQLQATSIPFENKNELNEQQNNETAKIDDELIKNLDSMKILKLLLKTLKMNSSKNPLNKFLNHNLFFKFFF